MSLTCVFCGKVAVQVEGQRMPAGALVTVPAPAGGGVTVNWNEEAAGSGCGGEDCTVTPQPVRKKMASAEKMETKT